jgi:hypothetical protein
MSEIKEIPGVVDLISWRKDFGQNKEVNIRVRGAEEEWRALVSSEECDKGVPREARYSEPIISNRSLQ